VAKVNDIPDMITIDLADLGIGDVVHGEDLKLPTGVELGLHQAHLAFVAITGKMAEEADATKKAAAEPAAAAPAKAAASKPAPGAAPKAAAPAAAKPAAKPAGKK